MVAIKQVQRKLNTINGHSEKASCQSGLLPIIYVGMLGKIQSYRSGVGLRISPQEKMN